YSRRYHWPICWTGDGSDYSARLHAADLAALIEALDLDAPHIISASYGSYVALIHALAHPDQVRSLVVAEPPMMRWLARMAGGAELAESFQRETWRPAAAAFARGDLEAGVRIFVDGVNGR